jgi:hypothetical protein
MAAFTGHTRSHKSMLPNDPSWQCLLELDARRNVVSGSAGALCEAIARGADLRVYTEWLFEEHVAPDLGRPARDDEAGLVQEVIDFREAILVGDDYAAGITTHRQAILPTVAFNRNGPPRMSFFIYDTAGRQACANVLFDEPFEVTRKTMMDAAKMHDVDPHDAGSYAPSCNFVYDMERYRYFVRDDWRQALCHDAGGRVVHGSFEDLHAAHHAGCDIKIAVRDLAAGDSHEIITPVGTSWVHTARRELEALTHPLVRVAAARPLRYASRNWDVAWVFLSTTGAATVRRFDPQRRQFTDEPGNFACRWFVR